MKKNLVYAMMLVAAMSSCSKDSDAPATPSTPQEEGDVAISLSALPQGMVATRGYGMVGDDDQNISANIWSEQKLYFIGAKKVDGNVSFADDNMIIKNLEATAPNSTANGEIGLFGGKTVYYPRTGAYDFFGYHADNAFISNAMTLDGEKTTFIDSVYVAPFKIDGTQDLMIAKAVLNKEDSLVLYKKEPGNSEAIEIPAGTDFAPIARKAYSAYSSRANIVPAMTFEHLLTRLNFFVVGGGKAEADRSDYVYVKSVKVYSNTTGKLVAAYRNEADKGIKWDTTNPAPEYLPVKEKPSIGSTATSDLQDLNGSDTFYETLVADYANLPTAGDAGLGAYHSTWNTDKYEAKLVGAPILVQPNPEGEIYKVKIEVVQFYDKNGNKIPAPTDPNNNFKKGLDQRYWEYELKVNAKDLKQKEGTPDPIVNAFQAGHSYNVILTVYSLQDIKINVTLGAWTFGGEISLNPDDDFQE